MSKFSIKVIIILLLIQNSFIITKEPKTNLPKIYGIMITGKDELHYHLAIGAILSFLQQTYPNKHLIIINDGNYNFNFLDKSKATEINPKKQNLGALRNIAIDYLKENDLWIQWDDDDWRHPNLIEEQYNFLEKNKLDACILQKQIQYCFKLNKAKVVNRNKRGIEGTILCKNKKSIKYPITKKQEDTVFFKEYKRQYKIKTWNNPPSFYLRFIHGYNTWEDKHFILSTFKPLVELKENKLYLEKTIDFYKKIIRYKN